MILFAISFMALIAFCLMTIVRLAPRSVRSGTLYMATFFSAFGALLIIFVPPYIQAKLKDQTALYVEQNANPSSYPFYSVGQVFQTNAVSPPCTGTLVEPQMVLTSAFCVTSVSARSGFTQPQSIYVQFPSRPVARVQDYVIGKNYDFKKDGFLHSVEDNWALLYLEQPIKDRSAIPIKRNDWPSHSSFISVGFKGKLGDDQKIYEKCSYIDDPLFDSFLEFSSKDSRYDLHSCHVWEQASGLPLLYKTSSDMFQVTGLHNTIMAAYGATLGVSTPVRDILEQRGIVPYEIIGSSKKIHQVE